MTRCVQEGCAIMSSAVSRAGWMRQGRYGLMVHWLAPGPHALRAQRGPHLSDLNAAVDAFDVERFVGDVRRTGAAWLIFTIGQNTGYYAAPNHVLDELAGPGHAPRRDLVREIAERCRRACRKFIAYLPVEVQGQDEAIRRAFGWTDAEGTDQAEFQRRYAAFIRDYALGLGDLVDGWWFDGAYEWPVFHNSHLDVASILAVARAGNPEAAVAFNDGSFCVGKATPAVAGQDYLAGETEALIGGKVRLGRHPDAPLLDPATHDPQPPPGCLWHALVPIDCNWAHGNPWTAAQHLPLTPVAPVGGEMEPPLYSVADLETLVRDFKAAGGAVTFNVGIFQEGGLGEATVAQLAELTGRLARR
jgi:hypothetical protein